MRIGMAVEIGIRRRDWGMNFARSGVKGTVE